MRQVVRKMLLILLMVMIMICACAASLSSSFVNCFADEITPQKNYSLYVNRTQNVVAVYEVDAEGKETLYKTMVCSVGRAGHGTPRGTFKTDAYYEWHLMVDGSYGRYCVRFNKMILFHSVPYLKRSKDALEWDQYNLLGQKASLGCVRLSVRDAKWLYENCRPGTKVVVYDDAEGDPIFYKPASCIIPEDSPFRGWDPTDSDPANPWYAVYGVGEDGLPAYPVAKTDTKADIEHFNYVIYADMYPDLKMAYGYNKDALYMHYLSFGRSEGRVALFNK